MNFESGFLAKDNDAYQEKEGFTGFQTLSLSKTGFFRILVGKHLGRKVVIKTLKDEHSENPIAITQLKKEFSILFPLISPNVVQALGIITSPEGVPAFEMEWCDGSDVRGLLYGEMEAEDALRIIRGVLNGLRDIHLAAIVHRDIKPENVMYDPFRKVVKIIDFGCGYVTGGIALQGPNGTPDYTPEEKMQVGSEAEPKDDLYALGIMISEMADNLSADSKRAASVKRKLTRFSDNLRAGEYEKAENAIEAFEKLFQHKTFPWLPMLCGLLGIFVIVLLMNSYLQSPVYYQENVSREMIADTVLKSEESPVKDNAEDKSNSVADTEPIPESGLADDGKEKNSVDKEREENPVIEVPYLEGEWKNPYSGISSDDEAAYELAVYAGKLLEMYNSNHVSQRVKMDGFVVHFCDSLYLAEKMYSQFPDYMEADKIRDTAKELAEKYKNKMEIEFNKNFGVSGDPHRRSVMLEGRFYAYLRDKSKRKPKSQKSD